MSLLPSAPATHLVICVGGVQFFKDPFDADRDGEPWLLELRGEDDVRCIGASLGYWLPRRPRGRPTPLVWDLVATRTLAASHGPCRTRGELSWSDLLSSRALEDTQPWIPYRPYSCAPSSLILGPLAAEGSGITSVNVPDNVNILARNIDRSRTGTISSFNYHDLLLCSFI